MAGGSGAAERPERAIRSFNRAWRPMRCQVPPPAIGRGLMGRMVVVSVMWQGWRGALRRWWNGWRDFQAVFELVGQSRTH